MGNQYIFPISNTVSEYNSNDFIFSNCNFILKTIIDCLPLSSGINPYKNIVVVTGDKKSGKTHFANLFQKRCNATWIDINDHIKDMQGQYFVIDDIDIGFDEEKLFHIFNYICENNKVALFTCSNYQNFKLGDLSSRIKSIRNFSIMPPDDVMIKTLLSKHLIARSLHVSEEVIKFLLNRIPRSFETIFKYVDFIDRLSLERKRNISVPFLSSLEFPDSTSKG